MTRSLKNDHRGSEKSNIGTIETVPVVSIKYYSLFITGTQVRKQAVPCMYVASKITFVPKE